VDSVEDVFCKDDMDHLEPKKTKSVESQTLEREPLPNAQSKPGFDYCSALSKSKSKEQNYGLGPKQNTKDTLKTTTHPPTHPPPTTKTF
jgi:hypothetical protein